jgi:cell division protein FtsI (penicillin-binding protein 3)
VSAPVFKNVMEGALRLMDVPPDDIDTWIAAQQKAASARPVAKLAALAPAVAPVDHPVAQPVATPASAPRVSPAAPARPALPQAIDGGAQ